MKRYSIFFCLTLAFFSLSIFLGCASSNSRVETKLNDEAKVESRDLPVNPIAGKVITSWVNKADSTMSTLFGNDSAVHAARMSGTGGYPAGAVLSLVTWRQKEDDRWFGGRIPARVQSVEVIRIDGVTGSGPSYHYHRYEGSPLHGVASLDGQAQDSRTKFILSQRAAVMP